MKCINYENVKMTDKRNVFVKLKEMIFDDTPFFTPNQFQYVINKNDDQYFRVIKSRNKIRIFADHNNEGKLFTLYNGKVDIKMISNNKSLLTVTAEGGLYNQYKTTPDNNHKYLKVY